jgi:hypothetical protein
MSRHEYLVSHSYGMGGFVWWIEADSPAQILDTLSEVSVVTDPDEIARAAADIGEIPRLRLDDLGNDGVLLNLRDRRARDKKHPAYGVLARRMPVFLRDSAEDGAEFLMEVVAEDEAHGVPTGRRRRIVRRRPDGRADRVIDWPIEPTFDVYNPVLAAMEITPAEFERAWLLTGSVDEPRSVTVTARTAPFGSRPILISWTDTSRVAAIASSASGVTRRVARAWSTRAASASGIRRRSRLKTSPI